MNLIFIERLLQPHYLWMAIKRKFWWYCTRLRPFCNITYTPLTTYYHMHWLNTLHGVHGWHCVNGKLVYFEDYVTNGGFGRN